MGTPTSWGLGGTDRCRRLEPLSRLFDGRDWFLEDFAGGGPAERLFGVFCAEQALEHLNQLQTAIDEVERELQKTVHAVKAALNGRD